MKMSEQKDHMKDQNNKSQEDWIEEERKLKSELEKVIEKTQATNNALKKLLDHSKKDKESNC